MSGLAPVLEGEVLLSVQEDDFEPRFETLAEFVAGYDYPEAQEDNARAIALQVGEQFAIDEGPLTRAPVWTIKRLR